VKKALSIKKTLLSYWSLKIKETKNLQKRQVLPARPPPNKFEGATLYAINY